MITDDLLLVKNTVKVMLKKILMMFLGKNIHSSKLLLLKLFFSGAKGKEKAESSKFADDDPTRYIVLTLLFLVNVYDFFFVVQ
jgi:hypothetical protein